MEDGRLSMSILLDLYGPLLTERQRSCCEMYYNDDLSLSEIAEQLGSSRQSVWDNIKRSGEAMEEYEAKLSLSARMADLSSHLEAARQRLANGDNAGAEQEIARAQDGIYGI